MDTHEKAELLNLTTKIVTAYVTKNPVGIAELCERWTPIVGQTGGVC